MHVFLATDGSQGARAAEQWVAAFPFASPPKVTIATVCPAADLESAAIDLSAPVQSLLKQCRQDSEKLLEATAARVEGWTSQVDTLLLDGHPADELLRAIDKAHPDVVVVGSRGLGTVRRWLLGSVSERIAAHARCSVLIVREAQESRGPQRVLIAHDGSPAADAAIDRFARLPLGSNRSVSVVGVVETMPAYGTELLVAGDDTLESAHAAAEARLQAAGTRLSSSGAAFTTTVRRGYDVASTILDEAAAETSDLIVLGSRGKSALDRFLLGSASLRVVNHAHCSVWIERLRR
jgi:nucleotide-binding universal stress UspA family protein